MGARQRYAAESHRVRRAYYLLSEGRLDLCSGEIEELREELIDVTGGRLSPRACLLAVAADARRAALHSKEVARFWLERGHVQHAHVHAAAYRREIIRAREALAEAAAMRCAS